jgi:hypothetical protein
MSNVIPDPELCFDVIVVQVEDHITRVPRRLFAKSPVFQDMLSLPQATSAIPEGMDDQHPLKLEGVKYNDYKLFVRTAFIVECVQT